MRIRVPFVLVLALTSTACASTRSAAVQGCVDFVDAFADGAAMCGLDREANRVAIEQSATRGRDCGVVSDLRDPDALYAECIPWIEALTCAQLGDATLELPPSCRAQLVQP